jgi:RNA polymerase sigma factor (sigma-70 family)
MRYLANRHCAAYAEDCVQEALIAIVQNLRRREIKEPKALPAYVRTILLRVAADKRNGAKRMIGGECFEATVATASDAGKTPEEYADAQKTGTLLRAALQKLADHEREILKRFYLDDEEPRHIRESMGLSETQFRLLKSRSLRKLKKFLGPRTTKPSKDQPRASLRYGQRP